ncbi:hypothetical protein ABG067_003179 [Albugo candida]
MVSSRPYNAIATASIRLDDKLIKDPFNSDENKVQDRDPYATTFPELVHDRHNKRSYPLNAVCKHTNAFSMHSTMYTCSSPLYATNEQKLNKKHPISQFTKSNMLSNVLPPHQSKLVLQVSNSAASACAKISSDRSSVCTKLIPSSWQSASELVVVKKLTYGTQCRTFPKTSILRAGNALKKSASVEFAPEVHNERIKKQKNTCTAIDYPSISRALPRRLTMEEKVELYRTRPDLDIESIEYLAAETRIRMQASQKRAGFAIFGGALSLIFIDGVNLLANIRRLSANVTHLLFKMVQSAQWDAPKRSLYVEYPCKFTPKGRRILVYYCNTLSNMWKLYEAAKNATANASEYVTTVQEKAHSIVATVQDEASLLLSAIGNPKSGPIDEILYDEIDAYKSFEQTFSAENHTEEIENVLASDKEIGELHEELVPLQLSFEEFWCRYFFRRKIAEQAAENMRMRRSRLSNESMEALEDKSSPSPRSFTEEDWKSLYEKCQQKLSILQARQREDHAEEKIEHEMQYQSLCDAYESKMVEITLQIDAAKNAGMEEGVRESEGIIASLKDSHQLELDQLKQKICILEQQINHNSHEGSNKAEESSRGDEECSTEIARLQQALLSKEKELAKCQEKVSKVQLVEVTAQQLQTQIEQLELLLGNEREQAFSSQKTIATLKAEVENERSKLQEAVHTHGTSIQSLHKALLQSEEKLNDANSEIENFKNELSTLKLSQQQPEFNIDSLKKEIELWKVRAMKMKKLKEQVEADLIVAKSQSLDTFPKDRQSEIEEYEKKLQALTEEKENAFESGRKEGAAQADAALTEMKNEWIRKMEQAEQKSFDRGVATTRLEMEAQIAHLREELEKVTILSHSDAHDGATESEDATNQPKGKKLQDWGEW